MSMLSEPLGLAGARVLVTGRSGLVGLQRQTTLPPDGAGLAALVGRVLAQLQ